MAVAAPRARPDHRSPAERKSSSLTPARPRRRAERRRLSRGVVWILAIAGLLAGIVALQVSVLQLRMESGRLQSEIVQIRAENARIESEIASAGSVARVEGAAHGRLGLVESSETTYVELPGR
jgi:cell division protein FtsL